MVLSGPSTVEEQGVSPSFRQLPGHRNRASIPAGMRALHPRLPVRAAREERGRAASVVRLAITAWTLVGRSDSWLHGLLDGEGDGSPPPPTTILPSSCWS